VVRVRAQGGMKWNDTAGDYRVRGLQWGGLAALQGLPLLVLVAVRGGGLPGGKRRGRGERAGGRGAVTALCYHHYRRGAKRRGRSGGRMRWCRVWGGSRVRSTGGVKRGRAASAAVYPGVRRAWDVLAALGGLQCCWCWMG